MENDIEEIKRQREICQDFLSANPNVQMVGIGNTLMDRAGVVNTKQRLEAPTLYNQIKIKGEKIGNREI